MLRDITLGQYFPGNSVLHRASAKTKIILSVIAVVAVFLAVNEYGFALILAMCIAITLASRLSLKLILRGMKPLIFIIVLTAVINMLWTSGQTLLVHFWIVRIYLEGVIYAVFMVIRILSLVVLTSILLSYTTSPIELTDAIEALLSPFKRIGLPAHEFAMMMSIALRFIPTLLEQTDMIIQAQRARGADFDSGSVLRRVKSFVPVLIPLIISAFRRADELATAMECRCYHGGEGRTKLNIHRLGGLDYALFAAGAGFFALMAAQQFVHGVFRL